MLNCTCFTALYQMGWDADKIIERFEDVMPVWQECASKGISALELLEEETGIEIALDGEKSWHDFDQLNHNNRVVSDPEYIYSIYRRVRWYIPSMLACLMLTLHRQDGWEYETISEFISRTDDIRRECGDSLGAYKDKMMKVTGYTPRLWGDGNGGI